MDNRQQIAGLVQLLLPKNDAASKYARSGFAIDDVRFHLELALSNYRAAEDEQSPASKKDTEQAISSVKRLRAALQKPGMRERIEQFNATPFEQVDELHDYRAAYGASFEYQNFLQRLARLEHLLVAATAPLPKATPDRALRCAVAPLFALFREHNPNATLWRGSSGDSRATKFIVAALRALDISATESTVGRLSPDELPFIDW